MKVTGAWIEDPRSQRVCQMLRDAGYRALFVGGCVRNALLNEPVGDIDLSTDAHPKTVMALAREAGLKPVPTGIDHGTVTVVAEGLPHEITTFRRDLETDGRRAVVAFADDIAEDAVRRDFTMNALYAEADGTVVDPLGGLPDLQARQVRFIRDAEQRIREDYLRILRFFRFHAWYGDAENGLDAEGLAACAALADGLESLSKERIGAEMLKLLAAPDPAPSVMAFQHSGGLTRILPGTDAKALAPLVHLESEADVAPDPLRRLACLGDIDYHGALRLSRQQSARTTLIRQAALGGAGPQELGYRLGETDAVDAWLIRSALMEQPLDLASLEKIQNAAKAKFPVKPADLQPEFQGKALGDRLKALEAKWIASGFSLTREDLLSS